MTPRGSLGRKFLMSLAAGITLASLVFLVLFIEIYRSRLALERGNASDQVSRLLQVSLENAMLKRDLPGLQDIVSRLGKQPGIASVRIVNPAGVVRFSSDPSTLDSQLSLGDLGCETCAEGDTLALSVSNRMMRLADGRDVLRSVNPIANREACLACHGPAAVNPVNGILVVDHDAAGLKSDALHAAAAMSGAGLLVMLAGLLSVWLMLKRQVLQPIFVLDRASRALAAGDLGSRVKLERKSGGDEIEGLCDSFNGMAERIEQGLREVQEKETFLKALLDTVPDGVRVIDEGHRIVMANESYARQVMAPRESVIGEPCFRAHGLSEPCAPTLVTCPFHAIRSDGDPIRYIHRHVRSDGTEVHVETTAARLTITHEGRPQSYIIEAIRDLEQQVRFSHEQRLSEIGQLAAGVAHEIYNPLASIRLGLQAVLRRLGSGNGAAELEARDYLGMVDGEVDNCIRVTKRLLDLSQTPSNSLQLVSFSNIVPDVVSLLRFEAEHRSMTLDVDLGAEELRVLATDQELRMLVLNLTQNAFHAMPGGGTLTITGRHEGENVVVSFADTGVGISPEALAQIFNPFYSRRADGIHGTGLGLTICRSIVNRYHGAISAQSTLGAGATFTISFPRADAGGASETSA